MTQNESLRSILRLRFPTDFETAAAEILGPVQNTLDYNPLRGQSWDSATAEDMLLRLKAWREIWGKCKWDLAEQIFDDADLWACPNMRDQCWSSPRIVDSGKAV